MSRSLDGGVLAQGGRETSLLAFQKERASEGERELAPGQSPHPFLDRASMQATDGGPQPSTTARERERERAEARLKLFTKLQKRE